MTSISYDKIFSDFLGNVSDYKIASMNDSDVVELMTEYLHKSLSRSYIRVLFSTVNLDDEIQTLSFEMDYKVDDDQDKWFIINVLAKAMVVEWLKPEVRNRLNTAQMFGTKEQKYYSQSQHISELRGLLEDTELELQREIKERNSQYNSYLDET